MHKLSSNRHLTSEFTLGDYTVSLFVEEGRYGGFDTTPDLYYFTRITVSHDNHNYESTHERYRPVSKVESWWWPFGASTLTGYVMNSIDNAIENYNDELEIDTNREKAFNDLKSKLA